MSNLDIVFQKVEVERYQGMLSGMENISLTLNQRVQGSSPCAPTKYFRYLGEEILIA